MFCFYKDKLIYYDVWIICLSEAFPTPKKNAKFSSTTFMTSLSLSLCPSLPSVPSILLSFLLSLSVFLSTFESSIFLG